MSTMLDVDSAAIGWQLAAEAVSLRLWRSGDVVALVVFVVTVIRGWVRALAEMQLLWQPFCAVAYTGVTQRVRGSGEGGAEADLAAAEAAAASAAV